MHPLSSRPRQLGHAMHRITAGRRQLQAFAVQNRLDPGRARMLDQRSLAICVQRIDHKTRPATPALGQRLRDHSVVVVARPDEVPQGFRRGPELPGCHSSHHLDQPP